MVNLKNVLDFNVTDPSWSDIPSCESKDRVFQNHWEDVVHLLISISGFDL